MRLSRKQNGRRSVKPQPEFTPGQRWFLEHGLLELVFPVFFVFCVIYALASREFGGGTVVIDGVWDAGVDGGADAGLDGGL